MANGIPFSNFPLANIAEIQADWQLYAESPDGLAYRIQADEFVSKMQTDAGNLGLQMAKLEIPTAEVLQLFTTPKAFGIAVPSGYYVQPISCQMKATYAGVPYATNVDLEVGFLGVKPIFFDAVLGFSSNAFVHLDLNDSGAMTAASDMVVSVNAGNPTAGTSDITIYLTYALIEL